MNAPDGSLVEPVADTPPAEVQAVATERARIGNVALVGDLVLVDDKPVSLTRREYQFLEFLLLAGDHAVVSGMRLRSAVYGSPARCPSNVEQQYVLRIRKALRAAGSTAQLNTVRNRGYMWEVLPR